MIWNRWGTTGKHGMNSRIYNAIQRIPFVGWGGVVSIYLFNPCERKKWNADRVHLSQSITRWWWCCCWCCCCCFSSVLLRVIAKCTQPRNDSGIWITSHFSLARAAFAGVWVELRLARAAKSAGVYMGVGRVRIWGAASNDRQSGFNLPV